MCVYTFVFQIVLVFSLHLFLTMAEDNQTIFYTDFSSDVLPKELVWFCEPDVYKTAALDGTGLDVSMVKYHTMGCHGNVHNT